jgi:hypothetical protein
MDNLMCSHNKAAVPLMLAILTAAAPASAHVSSGINCAQCHSSARDAYSVQDFQSTIDRGQGPRPVFAVRAGDTAPIGINVVNGASEYGINFNVQNKAGLSNSANTFAFTPDGNWVSQRNSTYFTRGPLSSNSKSTFQLKVEANTPADLYQAEVLVAGKGNNMWNHRTNIYVQVISEVQVPRLESPVITEGSFACSVATQPGVTYVLELQAVLGVGTWSPVAQVTGDGTTRQLKDPSPAGAQGYYRVRVE